MGQTCDVRRSVPQHDPESIIMDVVSGEEIPLVVLLS